MALSKAQKDCKEAARQLYTELGIDAVVGFGINYREPLTICLVRSKTSQAEIPETYKGYPVLAMPSSDNQTLGFGNPWLTQ